MRIASTKLVNKPLVSRSARYVLLAGKGNMSSYSEKNQAMSGKEKQADAITAYSVVGWPVSSIRKTIFPPCNYLTRNGLEILHKILECTPLLNP